MPALPRTATPPIDSNAVQPGYYDSDTFRATLEAFQRLRSDSDSSNRTAFHETEQLPELFRHDSGKLVPLEGEDIGRLIARAVEASATERRPWYEPTEKLPQEPLINSAMLREFDTLVVEMPARESLPAGSQQLLGPPMQPAEAS